MRWISCATVLLALILTSCSEPSHAEPAVIAHPDNNAAKIEFFEKRPSGNGPWPTVILLHGHQGFMNRIGGRAFSNWGVLDRLAQEGYLAVSISLPGYGGSSGPEDFAGPFTQHAVEAVIAKLRAKNLAISDKVLIEGISLGAVTGALVATRDRQLAGLVLISGLYDLPAFFRNPKSAGARDVKSAVDAQTGGSVAALQIRSALPLASQIRASTLILNGAQDDRTDVDQAKRLADAIKASGGKAIVHIFPDFAHAIPVEARDAEVNDFIETTLRHKADRSADRVVCFLTPNSGTPGQARGDGGDA